MHSKKIIIGSDHGGFELKKRVIEFLKTIDFSVEDVGTYTKDSCDYPTIAEKVATKIQNKEYDRGILICGTGIGMSIAANKFKGIRAAVVSDPVSAKLTKAHNNANIICFGERIIGELTAIEIVKEWLFTEFEGGRHLNRINLIEK